MLLKSLIPDPRTRSVTRPATRTSMAVSCRKYEAQVRLAMQRCGMSSADADWRTQQQPEPSFHVALVAVEAWSESMAHA